VSTNTAALRGGIEKIQFVKTSFDSVLGRYFKPISVNYTVPMITNYTLINQSFRRVLRRPDILFSADDLGTALLARSAGFIETTNANVSFVGPGVFLPQMDITFNKIGPFFFNFTPFFLDEVTATKGFLWGSFDGSTNDPIVYPKGTSIKALERQVLNQ
jgi:hypothetical protein